MHIICFQIPNSILLWPEDILLQLYHLLVEETVSAFNTIIRVTREFHVFVSRRWNRDLVIHKSQHLKLFSL